MRVATYVRISTDEEHQPYSLEAQTKRLGSYIESQDGWELVREFSDQASGAKTDRPGLQKALTEARAGRFDLLLVYRVDRFSRSVHELAGLIKELEAVKVAFQSATEPFDTTTPAGRMMVQMLGVFAEFERATIIDRVIAGMERKAARGEWTAGARPFGYNIDRDKSMLIVNPAESPLVPVIFDLYANQRRGAKTIANWLNENGHRTRTKRPWSTNAVLTVLRNRAYIGDVYFRGSHHKSQHETLVTQQLFDATQQLLAERGEDHSKRAGNASQYLLSGLVVCKRCGNNFVGGAATGRSNRYKYYTCCTRMRNGSKQCAAERVPADQLDTAILTSLLDTFASCDLVDNALALLSDTTSSNEKQMRSELESVVTEIHKNEDSIERYLIAFENGTLTETDCAGRLKSLSGRSAELRQRKADLEEAIEAIRLIAFPWGVSVQYDTRKNVGNPAKVRKGVSSLRCEQQLKNILCAH